MADSSKWEYPNHAAAKGEYDRHLYCTDVSGDRRYFENLNTITSAIAWGCSSGILVSLSVSLAARFRTARFLFRDSQVTNFIGRAGHIALFMAENSHKIKLIGVVAWLQRQLAMRFLRTLLVGFCRIIADVCLKQGSAFLNRSFNEYALRACTQALSFNPELTEAYAVRGRARYRLGDYDGAIDDYSAAIRLDRKRADVYLNRGLVHYTKVEIEDALADMNIALYRDPHEPGIRPSLHQSWQRAR